MTVPNISSPVTSTAPVDSSLSHTHPASLLIGELSIEGRSYIVSIESSEPLVPTPADSTREKIEYLVNLHLKHLELQGADLSKIVIQQLDEEGLMYVNSGKNQDIEQKILLSSEIDLPSSKPFHETDPLPSSLQSLPITSIKDIYNSIIEPLIAKKNEEKKEEKKEETFQVNTKKFGSRVIFTPNPQKALVQIPENSTLTAAPQEKGHREKESSSTISKREEDDFNTETKNTCESESSNGLWARVRNLIPSFSFWSGSYDIVDTTQVVKEEKESFLRNNPEVKDSLKRFENINLQ